MIPSRTPARLRSALRLGEGYNVFLVYGSGVMDHFVGRDLTLLDLGAALCRMLIEEKGFRRVVFYDGRGWLYFHDDDSRRRTTPNGGRQARLRQDIIELSGGPLGRRKILPAAPAAPDSVATRMPSDADALPILDAVLRDESIKTAVVLVRANQILRYHTEARQLFDRLESWSALSPENENIVVVLFDYETLTPLAAFFEQHRADLSVPAWENLLIKRAGGERVGNVVRIGGPEEEELHAIVQRARLLGSAQVDWREERLLTRAAASAQRKAREWIPFIRQGMRWDRDTLSTSLKEDNMPDSRPALERLDEMTGLANVKRTIHRLVVSFQAELEERRERPGRRSEPKKRHMVFYGPPGTGKTTVARLVGEICRDYGILARGHLVEVSAEELTAEYVGQTLPKANSVIDSAIDGVLFIDEAYRLVEEGRGTYGKEVVELLLRRLNDDADRLIVIVAGYTDEMQRFLQSNPGLPRRFLHQVPFESFSAEELQQILWRRLAKRELTIAPEMEARLRLVVQELRRTAKPKLFGNAGEMTNLADKLQERWRERRLAASPPLGLDEPLRLQDLPEEYQQYVPPALPTLDAVMAELNALVGLAPVKTWVQRKRNRLQRDLRSEAAGARECPHFIFVGNPGTGKTTVARIIGQILRDLGILQRGHVVDISPNDLIADHVGGTGPKAEKKIEEALDGVLFIDEAYGLNSGNQNSFAAEAVNTLVRMMENHRDRLTVIVAGYPEPMKAFVASNPGLASRFRETVPFPDYSDEELIEILRRLAAKERFHLTPAAEQAGRRVLSASRARNPTSFGNAREVRNLLEAMRDRQADRLAELRDVSPQQDSALEAEDVPDVGQPPPRSEIRMAFDLVSCLPALAPDPTTPEEAIPAVVYIEVDLADGREGSGTGFLVSPEGHVLTAHHVAAGARAIRVYPGTDRSRAIQAELVGADAEADIAVLRLPGSGYPCLPLAERGYRPRMGEPVSSLSYPLGTALGSDPSYEQGAISSHRNAEGVQRLQFSATVTHGSSGGPVFRQSDFRVIGVVFGGARPDVVSGINLATSINEVYARFGPGR